MTFTQTTIIPILFTQYLSTVAVTVGFSRPDVNHCYIKDRLGVPYIYRGSKASFQKTVLILTRPSDASRRRSRTYYVPFA